MNKNVPRLRMVAGPNGSGKSTIKSGDGGWGIAPRTAIGQRKDGAILMLVIDGRQTRSVGATLKDVQNTMLQYGAVNATNLDGGSSASMYYEGEVINNPSDPLGERSVPSAIYVKPQSVLDQLLKGSGK